MAVAHVNDVNGIQKRCISEFVIAGDSHIFSMGASQSYSGPLALTPISNTRGHFLMGKWRGGRGEQYWNALVSHAKNRVVVLVVMGNQHFGHFLFARPPLFDFVDPLNGGALYPGAVIVPRRMVKALPMLNTEWVCQLIQRLREEGSASIVVIGTPPVREDYEDAREHILSLPDFRAKAVKLGIDVATCTFTPAPIMKRLWGVLQEALGELAHKTSVRFLPVPAQALDDKGYLAAQYRGPVWNFAHANELYGRLMLDHIVCAVGAA